MHALGPVGGLMCKVTHDLTGTNSGSAGVCNMLRVLPDVLLMWQLWSLFEKSHSTPPQAFKEAYSVSHGLIQQRSAAIRLHCMKGGTTKADSTNTSALRCVGSIECLPMLQHPVFLHLLQETPERGGWR